MRDGSGRRRGHDDVQGVAMTWEEVMMTLNTGGGEGREDKKEVMMTFRLKIYRLLNSYAVAMCNASLRQPLPPHEGRYLGGREA